MNIKRKFFIFLISICLINRYNYTLEYIDLFKSKIKIEKNGSIHINETIVYNFDKSNKHGIVREFPVYYKDSLGNNYNVGFKINSILKDNKNEIYKVKTYNNFKKIFIGDPKKYLKAGKYKYTLNYTTNRQIGFFKDHDEFYFNINGPNWNIPIKKLIAKIKLPQSINPDTVTVEGYTGYYGQKNKDYKYYINNKSEIVIESKDTLYPGQNITIVLSFEKNHIIPPSFYEKIYYLIIDNLYLLLLLIGLIILLIYNFKLLIKIKLKSKKETIIPLFGPPENLLPSAIRYIYKFKFDAKTFACEIVNMAVNNLIKVEYSKSFFSGLYTLKKIDNINKENIKTTHKLLLNLLFNNKKEITIDSKNGILINNALEKFYDYLKTLYSEKYFDYNTESSVISIIISSIFILSSLYFNITTISIVIIFINIFTIFLFNYLLQSYTKEGQKLVAEIKGFKLFLETTETERLKIIGTKPNTNPELFEKFLPYAIALDCEKQWSAQFATIFTKNNYSPNWISGPIDYINLSNFSYNLSHSLSSSINSISNSNIISNIMQPPGSSSGSSGKGHSGGGGGGGGGGSW